MSNSSNIVRAEDVKLGSVIRFKTISLRDTNTYSGTVIGIVDFERARTYGDVAATHLEMSQGASMSDQLKTDGLIDVTQQKFLIVNVSNGEITPFAFQWLKTVAGTFGQVEVIEVGSTYTIRLYNVSTTEASTALNLLKSNGFVCKLIKKTNGEITNTTV